MVKEAGCNFFDVFRIIEDWIVKKRKREGKEGRFGRGERVGGGEEGWRKGGGSVG